MSVRQNLSFHLVGVSHHTVGVPDRERFALSAADISAALEVLRQTGIPGVLLSTCNRCELYWCGPGDGATWFQDFGRVRGAGSALALTRYEGMAAVRHLFRVSAGLDSQILGELEVLGQVRRAYDAARAVGATTREMDLIFSAALAAGRRVRRETLLGRHPASVSSAAVDLVLQHYDRSKAIQVVLLGAGEVAEGVLRAFHQNASAQVSLLTRHPAKAQVLAQAWGSDVGCLGDLEARLDQVDVLIVATASPQPVVTAAQLSRAVQARNGRELLVVDLAVPRNVEPDARSLEGIRLLDLDDLQRLCCPAAGTESAALAEAEGLVEDELIRLGLSLRGRVVAPRLAELHRLSREMAEQESEWALAQLEALSLPEREIVRQMADRLVRRVLYPLSQNLRVDS